jgi:hypothetical protein
MGVQMCTLGKLSGFLAEQTVSLVSECALHDRSDRCGR